MTKTVAKGAAVFLDTNVFLRFNVAEAPDHAIVRRAVKRLLDEDCILWISRQVIREFSVVLTRPQTFMTPLTAVDVAVRLRLLLPFFQIADETTLVTDHLLTLMTQVPVGGKQIHDANIVATMQAFGINTLFTLNPVDFNRFSHQITVITLHELTQNGMA